MMQNNLGTPKCLLEAIHQALAFEANIILDPQTVIRVKNHIEDFLAQRFGVAFLRDSEISDILEKLFKEVVE